MNQFTTDRLWLVWLAAMAVGLHIQPTLTFGESAVRFSLSDVFGLLLAPFAAWLMLRNLHAWKRREARIAIAIIAATSVVMTIGLVKASMGAGGVSGWALVKYAGWYVLLYYGLLGLVGGAFAPERALRVFLQVFVLAHAGLVMAFIVVQWCGIAWPGPASPRMTGLMDNPNAFGLSLLCSLALAVGAGEQLFSRKPGCFSVLLCGLLAAGVLFTRSLAAFAGLLVVALIALAMRRDFARMALVACVGMLLYALPWASNSLARLTGFPIQTVRAGIGQKIANPDKYGFSMTARLESNARAIALWRQAPVLGAGFGVFYEREKQRMPENGMALQIHNTFLWILAELGLAGASLFSALFVFVGAILVGAWRKPVGHDPPNSGVALAGIMVLGAWVTMSMAHELLYQRIPWMILGSVIGLVLWRPPDNRQGGHSSRT